MPENVPGKGSRAARPYTTPEESTTASSHSALPSGDFTYTLEIVMNMQTTMGKLMEAVDSLKTQSKDQDRRHEELVRDIRTVSQDVHGAKMVIVTVGALVTIAVAIVGTIAIPMLFKIADLGTTLLLQKNH